MIQVAISRNPQTKSLANSSLHVAVNPSPVAPKSAFGYKDFKIPIVKLNTFIMLE
jgi:hypothetical protein